MSVPALTLITPELAPAEILAQARAALEGAGTERGRVALQLRARHLDRQQQRQLGDSLRELTRDRGALLLVNADLELASMLGADGAQLPERGPSVAEARSLLGSRALLGASRHDAVGVATAAREGASFVLLSPVYEVPGKGPALGLEAFASIARSSAIPIVALGGVRRERVAAVLRAGAVGIAVIREVFDAADPGAATRQLLAALATDRASAQ